MDMVVMDMDVATMERGKLMLRLVTLEEDMVAMVVMDMAVDTMVRERLRPNLDILEEDMVVTDMVDMDMEEDIMVKYLRTYFIAVFLLKSYIC